MTPIPDTAQRIKLQYNVKSRCVLGVLRDKVYVCGLARQ